MTNLTDTRKRGKRSNSYPAYPIQESIEFTTPIYNSFGDTIISREDIAEVHNRSVGNVVPKISACVQYNLLELKSGKGYRITPNFVSAYKPLDEEEKRSALLSCFKSPKLYGQLVEEFDGKKLPDEKGLPTILFRKYDIAENVSEKAANIFIENATFLRLLKEDNLFSTNPTDTVVEVENEELNETLVIEPETLPSLIEKKEPIETPNSKSKTAETADAFNEDDTVMGYDEFQIRLDNKRKMAYIKMPKDPTMKDFDMIINWARLNKDAIYYSE